MGKRIVLLIIFGSFIASSQVSASRMAFYYPESIAKATGTIRAKGRNSITIFDEENKVSRVFICFNQADGFRTGDRVRVYYQYKTGLVQMVKKMPDLEYKKGTQNLGYISR